MQKFTFNRQSTGLFTDQQIKLSYNQEEFLPFIGQTFSKENFLKQIKAKKNSFFPEKRELLVSALKEKYANFEHPPLIHDRIESLKSEKTFTITTGHQLSIFTGPVYLIYKIIHVIRLTEELQKEYPEYNFVPVYWMASEDHDFEEIKTVEIFHNKLSWETNQSGPVGRFEIEELEAIKSEVLSFFENQQQSEVDELLSNYTGKNLAEATFGLLNRLFRDYGLIIIDSDNAALKRMFIPVIEKELKEKFSYAAVQKTNEKVGKAGLKLQVHAREINLFYIEDQFRERIIPLDDGYYIEGIGKVSEHKLMFELYENPEKFSPNVVLRPVFQEYILPNLCYVGGVGEISYWLQLKGVFDSIDLPYPLIQPRVSFLWLDSVLSKKIAKVSLVLEDLFNESDQVKRKYLTEFASEEVNFDEIDKEVDLLKTQLLDKIISTDEHLDKFANAELVRLDKLIGTIKEKLVRTVKNRHDSAMNAISQIYEKVYPEGKLQERSLNLFSICPDGKVSERIEQIHNFMDPFDPDFTIIRE